MKHFITALSFALSLSCASGQSPDTVYAFKKSDSVFIYRETDQMSGKSYLFTTRDFVVANETSKLGFIVSPIIRDDLSVVVSVLMVGLGACNENDEIIVLFENGAKLVKKSWKPFNCSGEAYFTFTERESDLLRTYPMHKIRMTNGRTYKSYTGEVHPRDRRYFIQVFHCLDNNLIFERE